jgi:hypothetical protein
MPLALAWKHPGLPTEWTRVIEEMPADMLRLCAARCQEGPPLAGVGHALGVPGRPALTDPEHEADE